MEHTENTERDPPLRRRTFEDVRADVRALFRPSMTGSEVCNPAFDTISETNYC